MPHINHGLKQGFVPSDFAGAEPPYEVRVPSGVWSPYLVQFEKQKFGTTETMACVAFSALNCCEMQIKQQTGQEVNFSDRFLAKRSNTQRDGNWMYIVANKLQLEGCVLEEQWPTHPEPFTWQQYYEPIPQSVIDLTQDFRNKYDVFPKRLGLFGVDIGTADLQHHLRHAPLWVTIPGHAIAKTVLSMDSRNFTYLDSYPPFVKTRPITDIDSVWKIILTVKKGFEPMIIINNTSDPNTKFALAQDQKVGFADFPAFQNYTAGRTIINLTLPDTEFNKIPTSQAVIKS